MPPPGLYIISNAGVSTFLGLADDDKTVVGYGTADKAQMARPNFYFQWCSELTVCSYLCSGRLAQTTGLPLCSGAVKSDI